MKYITKETNKYIIENNLEYPIFFSTTIRLFITYMEDITEETVTERD